MGVTIQFESHRVELAAVYEMEHDPDVLEYLDQPPPIKLEYASAKGKRLAVLHTPDFFVLRRRGAGWEEWKAEEALHKLAERSPNRYVLDGGCWRSPPGEAHAGQFGLSYRLRSSKEIDRIFQRNIQFLEDYLRLDVASVSPVVRERVLAHVAAWPALSLEELLARTAGAATPDEIYLLVASGEVHVDLHAAALADSGKVHLFTSRDAAHRETMTPGKAQILQAPDTLPGIFHTDATLSWDGRNWRVINVGETTVGLRGEDQNFAELPLSAFESLVKQGRIKRTVTGQEPEHRPAGADRLLQSNERDLKAANRRVEIVRRHLRGEPPLVGEQAPARTLRRWLARYRAAESLQGAGYLGLLPRTHDRGNASRKLPDDSIRIMNEVIEREFEGIRQKNRYVCWVTMKRACEQKGVLPPSYVTFCLAVRKRAGFKQTLKRKGPRAAYAQEPFYFELDLKTLRHGDRPFEICHIDHTKLGLELTDSAG